jgi:hypothetical protein
VRLSILDRVTVRAPGLTVPLEREANAAVLTGTPQDPRLTGQVTARRGGTQTPAARVTVDDLRVSYRVLPVPGYRRDPLPLEFSGSVTGHATAVVARAPTATESGGSARIIMEISGRLPDGIKVHATSDPPMGEVEIYQLIAGLPNNLLQTSGLQEQGLGQMLSDRFMAALVAGFRSAVFLPFQEQLERMLGLTELGVTFAFDQPISLKVGKYLLENFLITYQRKLGENPNDYELDLSYRLPSGLRVNYHQEGLGGSRLDVGLSREF